MLITLCQYGGPGACRGDTVGLWEQGIDDD